MLQKHYIMLTNPCQYQPWLLPYCPRHFFPLRGPIPYVVRDAARRGMWRSRARLPYTLHSKNNVKSMDILHEVRDATPARGLQFHTGLRKAARSIDRTAFALYTLIILDMSKKSTIPADDNRISVFLTINSLFIITGKSVANAEVNPFC